MTDAVLSAVIFKFRTINMAGKVMSSVVFTRGKSPDE